MMIGFYLVNLLPPGYPKQFNLQTPIGTWDFQQQPNFARVLPQILKGQSANTYSMSINLPLQATDAQVGSVLAEALQLCLAMSFVTGAAVTIKHSLPNSKVNFMQVGSHFPRDRPIVDPAACITTIVEFKEFVEAFVHQYPIVNPVEKLLLLTHFFVDATACWSLEDMYLSGSTLLQVVADTEIATGRSFAKTHAQNRSSKQPGFFDYLAGAADRVGITPLNHDVVKVRNSLVHSGTLKGSSMPTQGDAAVPIAEAMHWFDRYMFAVLGINTVPRNRYPVHALAYGINSFSF